MTHPSVRRFFMSARVPVAKRSFAACEPGLWASCSGKCRNAVSGIYVKRLTFDNALLPQETRSRRGWSPNMNYSER